MNSRVLIPRRLAAAAIRRLTCGAILSEVPVGGSHGHRDVPAHLTERVYRVVGHACPEPAEFGSLWPNARDVFVTRFTANWEMRPPVRGQAQLELMYRPTSVAVDLWSLVLRP